MSINQNKDKIIQKIPKIYIIWSITAITFSLLISKNYSESITRILVLIFLIFQILSKNKLEALFFNIKNHQKRFIISGVILASFVEGFHMISTPVFLSLRVNHDTEVLNILKNYFIDLVLTIPVYILVFYIIWYFINKYSYSLWDYIISFGIAQTLGDGGIFFFLNSPYMIFFLPYPMTNYHAINIIPFLLVKNNLSVENNSLKRYFAIPSIILTYLFCGSIIQVLGKFLNLK